jgi:4-hydroxymandelate oxidase
MPSTRRDLLRSACAVAGASMLPSIAIAATTASAAEGLPDPVPPTPTEDTADLVSISDFERAAREKTPTMAWEYIAGGAGDENTLRWNGDAYQRIQLRPRCLVDVSALDTRVRLFGHELAFPIFLSPTAYHRLIHPEGEIATAKGAGAAGATMIVSSFATTSIDDVAKVATGPLWFQLYMQHDRGFTRALVERAQAAGCQAVCLTVDTPALGARNREARVKFALPAGMDRPNLKGLEAARSTASHLPPEGSIYSSILDPSLTWKDVEWLRGFAKVPVLLKGILNPDDAGHAVDAGAAGIIVSNHGARNLDTVPATITALPAVADRVAGRVPVLVDGGVRRGTDVLKALALGATAVGIGRPYLFGLAVDGAAGVRRVVEILRLEFGMAMALTGRATIAAIDRSVLWT